MARLISLAVILTLIVFLGITFFQVIAPFLLPLFLAGVLAILSQPLFRWLVVKTGRTPLAAGLTTAAVLATFLVPMLLGTVIATIELRNVSQRMIGEEGWSPALLKARAELDRVLQDVARVVDEFAPGTIDPTALEAEIRGNMQTMARQLSERTFQFVASTLGVLGTFLSLVVALMMFVIALYYFLADGPQLLAASEELIPVHVDYQRELRMQFSKVVRAVVVATLLAAIGQGLATAAALVLVGLGHFFAFFAIATLAAMIPLAGTWLVWAPCAAWLAYQGQWGAATFLTLFGVIVIGMMDNVIRTYILNTDAKLHPLLAFVSVLGALQVMGLWGIFVGPIVASCLHALIKIFNMELKEFSRERFSSHLVAAQSGAVVLPTPDAELPPAAAVEPPATTKSVTPEAKTETPASGSSRRPRRR